ncbi:MAG: hypothetical protein INR64_10890, partial [Caulobacteraceae bacterium]|nr:hypothetical protein [Caulobacter sp.]
MTPVQARTRRRAAGLAMSLVVHGALLLAFMSVAPRLVTLPRLPAPPEPVVELELRPHPRARGSEPSPPQRDRAIRASPSLAARRPRGAPLSAPPRSAAPAAISAGHNIAAGVAAPGDGEGRWRVSGGGDAAAAARALVR